MKLREFLDLCGDERVRVSPKYFDEGENAFDGRASDFPYHHFNMLEDSVVSIKPDKHYSYYPDKVLTEAMVVVEIIKEEDDF